MGIANSTIEPAQVWSEDIPLWALAILEYCNWNERGLSRILSRNSWRNTNTDHFFRFLSQRLAIEQGVYVSPSLPINSEWKQIFLESFKLKSLWLKTNEIEEVASSGTGDRFKINVYARFRPLHKKKVVEVDESHDHDENEVTLPLHQRLAMIKMSHKLKSNRQALQVLASEGGWFRAKWASIQNQDSNTSKTAFYVASDDNFVVKSPSKSKPKQSSEKIVACVENIDPISGRVVMIAPDVGLREFSFNGVMPVHCTQQFIYDSSTRRLVTDFLNGFNATAIVYGQTGSGKTFSMFGHHEASVVGADAEGRGIIPRACEEIFRAIEERKQVNGIDAQLAISYVEIYGNHVSDLLRYGARCGQSKVSSQRYVLQGAAEREVHNLDEIQSILEMGEQQKRRAATAMNDRSTRAHSLFIITLKQSKTTAVTAPGEVPKHVTITSRLFLADLGGSEQVKKSQVEAGANRTGLENQFSVGFEMADNMREAVYINLGLLALKKCIEALHCKAHYVPYADSKLTMLLSQGLGGNCKTSIIVCSQMDPAHSSETMATMRFGERCALVENEARNNATMLAAVLADIDAQIAALEKQILAKERWEMREVRRVDELAEDGTVEKAVGGVEIQKVAVLVGAETERKQLEALLIRRSRFTGEPIEDEASVAAKPKKVVGFGREYAELYGLGNKFDDSQEAAADLDRFADAIRDEADLPAVLRAKSKKGKMTWATGGQVAEEDTTKLAAKAARIKRNRLAYAGIGY